jgi:ABC-type bacteriocin/lantibiotic exporter with double-glycine peptidase domain
LHLYCLVKVLLHDMASLVASSLTPPQRLARLLRQYRREIRYIFLYALVSGLISLSLPLGIQAIIGLIAGGSISASWGVLVLFVIVGALLTGILRLMQLSIMEHLQRRIFTDSAMGFALRIPRLRLDTLRQEHIPEIVNRFFDTITLQKGLPKLLIDGITALLTVLFSLILLSFYHSSFVTFSLLLIIVLVAMYVLTGPRGMQTSLAESKYKYKLVHWLEEVGRVATTFKLAGDNRFPVIRADQLTANYLDARAKHWRVLMMQFVGGLVFRVLVLGGFIILGSLLVMNAELNIGQFVASEILILFVVDSVEKLILLYETGYDILTATEKLGQVADLPLESEEGIRVEEFCQNKPFAIEVRNLTFKFIDAENPTINDLNLKIESGQRVAIAGYSGAGKSTLMQIFSALIRDYQGAILYNGLPMQNLHLRSLRKHIGDISSQEDIFHGTIIENITLGRDDVSTQQVLQALEEVRLDHFIQQQPAGIETMLLSAGKNTPSSVISKILVARAIIGAPELLILEEPLAQLRLRDRIHISHLLTEPKQPWTLICTTDDPLLAAQCDRVIVMDKGTIVFDGNFEDVQKTEHQRLFFRPDERLN